MNKLTSRILGVFFATILAMASPVRGGLIVIDFGSGGTQGLPYLEDGFTFSLLSGAATISNGTDRNLSVSVPVGSTTAGVRIQATNNFDILSLNREPTTARNWKVSASSGAVLTIPHGAGSGTTTFPSTSAWKNLTYVDILHDANEDNAVITLDNFNFIRPHRLPSLRP